MASRSFPGCFGSLQGFFKGMAVVGGHIGGEDNLGYGQRVVQVKITTYAPHSGRFGLRIILPIKIQHPAIRSIEKDYLCRINS
jgi:hypothetical protein